MVILYHFIYLFWVWKVWDKIFLERWEIRFGNLFVCLEVDLKSHIYQQLFFSTNTKESMVASMKKKLGSHQDLDMGSVWELPVILSNSWLIRLSGRDWKLLSMARHITSAKSVLLCISNYLVQIALFPIPACNEVMQKPTLVKWDNCYQPIDCGNQCIKSILPFEISI